jgi:uncharacterized protein (TIGR02266 family)
MQPSILVVEDAPLLRELEALYLSRIGRVLTARSGAEGLELARRERPDLIVADLLMPHLDGAALCRAVKSEPTLAATPIVVLSASESGADRERAIRAGAADVIHKPVERGALLETVYRFFQPPNPLGQPRIELKTPIRMHRRSGDAWGTVRNLSRGGLFVESASTVLPNTELALELQLPETAQALAPTAEVIWSCDSDEEELTGMGLRFLALDGTSARRLAAYIAERMRRLPRMQLGATP